MFSQVSALVLLAQALAVTAVAVEKRSGGINVKLCTGTNFAGCQTVRFPTDDKTCTPFPANLQKNVKSLNVEVAGTSDDDCSFYLNTACTGDNYMTNYEKDLPNEYKGEYSGIVAAICGPS